MQKEAQVGTTYKNTSHPILTLRGKPVNPWLVLVSLIFGFFMSLLDVTIVNIAIPSIQSSLNTDLTTVTWVLNAYSLVFAMLLVTMGRFADQFGRKRIFMLGMKKMFFGLGRSFLGILGFSKLRNGQGNYQFRLEAGETLNEKPVFRE